MSTTRNVGVSGGISAWVVALCTVTSVTFMACKDKNNGPVPVAEARQQFANVCARCHGAEGTGGPPAGEGAPAPRNFHDKDFQKARTDADIVRVISGGKPPGMPAFGGMLNDAQIQGLVGVVRSFGAEQGASAAK
jgi:mono/diheme cytochrome c family protein